MNGYRYALSNPNRWIDPTGLESATANDLINCLVNPIECVKVYKCKSEAGNAAKKKYGFDANNTEQNAYKHCYWTCCMTKIIGPEEAERFAWAHEAYPTNTKCEKDMDQWNNDQGRKVTGNTPCDSHCSAAPLQDKPKGPCTQCGPFFPRVKTPSDW